MFRDDKTLVFDCVTDRLAGFMPCVNPPTPISIQRARATYRATHRGTRELDLLFGGFARALIPTLSETNLTHFCRLVDRPDHEIADFLRNPADQAPPDLQDFVIAFKAHVDALRTKTSG